jgi:sphinganine-1-phosphate aldolase
MLDLEPNAKYLSNLWEQVANLNYEKFLSDANRFINSY